MTMQQYCLKWNNHQPNFISVFSSLLNSESLVDVTLSAEGRHVQAHKLVLSACSSYFQSLFTINPCQHPIVILKDVKFTDLKVMVDFMYYGEVNVSQEQLPHILKTAEMLKIKGLAEVPVESSISRHSNSLERTEMHSANEGGWTTENQRQSMTPSPCPLSPGSRRKRLRKSSTGSGSGSTERTSEEHAAAEALAASSNSTLGTVIKPDPGGFAPEPNVQRGAKQHSSDSDVQRSSSHDSESDTTHQITLQIPQQQDINIPHSIESSASLDVPGPSVSTSQTVSGFHWGVIDHGYPTGHYSPCQLPISNHNEIQYTSLSTTTASGLANVHNQNLTQEQMHYMHQIDQKPPQQITNSPAQIMKRKRSLNPQADENFIRALEAVRSGGIGFCKAARMFGVNNRTLWLEYKKRGYPVSRLSIKNRKPENTQNDQVQTTSQPQSDQLQNQQPPVTAAQPVRTQHEPTEVIVSNPIAMISSAFLDGRTVELSPVFQRSRYFDGSTANGPNINMQNMNFESI